ncbi:MAG TPA: hypothetical protein VFQ84_07540 [Arenimonas sp.]|uniref:hypothetical protein n=1 Tax=Arenimonas sp. TaxID=1872635 RepID=UPI002D7F53CA|nr:hypothetical protein [Arenimonas sp.]HEU0153180.1 hypothetical protein [Arenimonas sp.]
MINPHLCWLKPQQLRSYPYAPDLEAIPRTPGIYIFYRKYGSGFEVFYVGKALNLRSRLKGQLNNLKLMNSIKSAANGARMLCYGEVKLKPGQKSDSAIRAAEKLLIRHFVEEGHELFNIQGVKLRVQTLTNERPPQMKKLIPRRTQVEA